MLFAKYSLKEIKRAGLFRLWVGLYYTQTCCFVFQLHIELGFLLLRTLNTNAVRLMTPPIQLIILVTIIQSVSPVIDRCIAHAYESILCLAVVPVFVTWVRCCISTVSEIWSGSLLHFILLWIVFYSIIHVYSAVITNVTGHVQGVFV